MKIAVVILNWNGRDMLRRFLPYVISRSTVPGARVYVADNGSTDGSLEMLAEEFAGVPVIRLDTNYGFAEGYNRALAQVEAEYVVLLNSDVEPGERWLEPMVAYMDAHPEVAACQPKLLSYSDRGRFEYAGACGGFIDGYGYPFCRGRVMSTVEPDEGQYDDPAPVCWASGAALFIRLTDYREVGGLDGRFFAHMEEVDLCWRLGARGRKLMCIPQSVIYHVGGATLNRENPQKTFLNFRNNLLTLYKNLPDNELRRVMLVRGVLDVVAALSFLLKGEWRSAKAVFRARREFRRLRPQFEAARRDNLSHATVASPYGRTQGCILVSYYLLGKKTFRRLKCARS